MYYFGEDDHELRGFSESERVAYFSEFKLPKPNIYQPKSFLDDPKDATFLPWLPMNLKIGTRFINLVIGNRKLKCLLEYEGWSYNSLPLNDKEKEILKASDPTFMVICLTFRKVHGNKRVYAVREFVGIAATTVIISPQNV